ncbi:FRG domain-containing protein [Sinorhizobium meliloti]|uniref:FRG domain-containing protein n=1 Tax=Rhizobium meliloti TaxID=382 RepID=UPI001295ECDB|nr:FRG domain-containing protein [Sinorhizobium meliloti]MQX92067.1 FRG domain-containing protein [Sinorhizobium meliloti]
MALRITRPVHRVASVSDFVQFVLNWSRNGQRPVAFRGERFTDWQTQPKVFRRDVGIYDHEKKAVRDLISVHPQEFRDDETMFDRLVRMQHYELPTRLLDVTINPLVALYFAAEEYKVDDEPQDGKVQALFLPDERQRYFDSDRVSCMANLANLTADEKKEMATAEKLPKGEFNETTIAKRLLWFVRIEKPHFEPLIDPQHLRLPVFVRPKMSNRRIIAQSGAFIIYGARRLRRSEVDTDLRLLRVIVPAEKKAAIREELERLGVHASSLFPEIDKAAGFIVKRYANC